MMTDRAALFSQLLLVACMIQFCGCHQTVPKIGPLEADSQIGHVFAVIDPDETEVTRIEAEFGVRPTFEHAPALFWRSGNILLTSPEAETSVSLPLRSPFDAKFMIGRDYLLFDKQVVDVRFKVLYRRNGDELAFWSERKSFAARGAVGDTDLCVLRYRRASGPLEEQPNMPEEQVTTHHFLVPAPGGGPSDLVAAQIQFRSGWEFSGRLRQSFLDCTVDQPCYGAHARELKNVGRNTINVTLNRPIGQRFEHLNPGDSVAVHEDIASISCERETASEEDVLSALCRAAPEEPACARRP